MSGDLREAAFDVDGPAGAAFAAVGGTAFGGALTGTKTAFAGTLD
jgi:hypothetical protein